LKILNLTNKLTPLILIKILPSLYYIYLNSLLYTKASKKG